MQRHSSCTMLLLCEDNMRHVHAHHCAGVRVCCSGKYIGKQDSSNAGHHSVHSECAHALCDKPHADCRSSCTPPLSKLMWTAHFMEGRLRSTGRYGSIGHAVAVAASNASQVIVCCNNIARALCGSQQVLFGDATFGKVLHKRTSMQHCSCLLTSCLQRRSTALQKQTPMASGVQQA